LTPRCCPRLRRPLLQASRAMRRTRARGGRGPTSSWWAGCRIWRTTRGQSSRRCVCACLARRPGACAPACNALRSCAETPLPTNLPLTAARVVLRTSSQVEDEPFIAEKFSTVSSESVSIRPALPRGSRAVDASTRGCAMEVTERVGGVWDSGSWWGAAGVEGKEEEGWVPGPSMTKGPRSFAAAVSANTTLFVFGGHDAKGPCNEVLSFDALVSSGWRHHKARDLRAGPGVACIAAVLLRIVYLMRD
jgi:hypothetical protein